MRTPSTGNDAPPLAHNDRPDDDPESDGQRPADKGSRTHTTSHGSPSPRLPHERDESSDSGTGGPSPLGQVAHDDAVGEKEATDRSDASDATYRETLRSRTPGAERDK